MFVAAGVGASVSSMRQPRSAGVCDGACAAPSAGAWSLPAVAGSGTTTSSPATATGLPSGTNARTLTVVLPPGTIVSLMATASTMTPLACTSASSHCRTFCASRKSASAFASALAWIVRSAARASRAVSSPRASTGRSAAGLRTSTSASAADAAASIASSGAANAPSGRPASAARPRMETSMPSNTDCSSPVTGVVWIAVTRRKPEACGPCSSGAPISCVLCCERPSIAIWKNVRPSAASNTPVGSMSVGSVPGSGRKRCPR